MDKKKLLELIGKKTERKQKLANMADNTESVEELRAMNEEIRTLNDEIGELQQIADSISDESERTSFVNAAAPEIIGGSADTRQVSSDMEYREAFRDLVLKGTEIPAELRADEVTSTGDVASAIPTVLVNQIIERMDSIGMILPLVTRTSYAAGVNIPTSSVKPVATWIAEGATSDKQKKTTGVITFSHHKLRCEVAMTMETGTMALSAFETTFVKNVADAMVMAKENAIINGTGTGQPTGILKGNAPTGQSLSIKDLEYKTLVDAEAALPQQYENNAKWFMSKKTFMGFVGMVDDTKQPIARVNYGIGGKPERFLLGREVILTGDYLPTFESATNGKVFAFIYDMSKYVLNTVYDMGIQRKQDWDTEDLLTKAVMAVDGKPVEDFSLVTLKKTTA